MKRSRLTAILLAVLGLGTGYGLRPVWSQAPTVTRSWTSVGDDSLSGTATAYQMRYRTVAPPAASDPVGREAWWVAATQVTNMPAPLAPGTTQAVTVTPAGGFTGGATYWFVIRTRDEVSNWSGWSNVYAQTITLIDVIRPAPITDLR